LSNDALAVRYFGEAGDDRLLLINFGCELRLSPLPCPLLAPPEGTEWQQLWSSESLEYGGSGTPKLERYDGWRLPGEAAIVLRPAKVSPASDALKSEMR
jgi:maltooligosyltrehalose trehalohydrolase